MDRQLALWLDFVSATVCMSPLLCDFTISSFPISGGDWKDNPMRVPNGVLLAPLGTALVAHQARSAIQWCLDFCDESSTNIFTEFTTAVEIAMLKMHEEKCLLLEMYDQSAEQMRWMGENARWGG
ncbi:hypothetical protein DFH08DRAFT_809867 [Mycena albidolilacea]|uniref:Uncharacterized protein n=1 Tax=Mycena albidolilacea TaxID=1033008 RepID=A0AAD7A0J1_9AGAR|nr:hypothetical protein DFH08DRAFT_809867 [Mycena albidolilacea]